MRTEDWRPDYDYSTFDWDADEEDEFVAVHSHRHHSTRAGGTRTTSARNPCHHGTNHGAASSDCGNIRAAGSSNAHHGPAAV